MSSQKTSTRNRKATKKYKEFIQEKENKESSSSSDSSDADSSDDNYQESACSTPCRTRNNSTSSVEIAREVQM